MRTLGWICFWLGITLLVIGLPLILTFTSTAALVGKVIIAGLVNIVTGWQLSHPKTKQSVCPNGHGIVNTTYCTYCGSKARR